jgi:hypothetical protein
MAELASETGAVAVLERRARQAEALVRVSAGISYEQPLGDVLTALSDTIVRETMAVAAGVLLMDPGDLSLLGYGTSNLPDGFMEGMALAARLAADPDELRRALAERRPWVGSKRAFMATRPDYQHMEDMLRDVTWTHSWPRRSCTVRAPMASATCITTRTSMSTTLSWALSGR